MTYPKHGPWWFIRSVGGWIFLFPLGIGLIMAAIAVGQVHKGWQLQTGGATVTGQVTALSVTTRSCGKDNHDTCTDYNVSYDFEVNGRIRHDHTTVGQGFFAGLTQGGPLQVRYVTADPAVNEVDIGGTLIAAVFLALLAAGFVGGGAYAVKTRVDLWRRMAALRDGGTVRQAVVTNLVQTGTRISNVTQMRMQWRDEAGATGESRMQRREGLPAVGNTITIYADPEGRLAPVWEGDSGTR